LKRITFIVNPHASNGSAGRQWPHIQAKAKDRLGAFKTLITNGPGDATRLAKRALLSGTDILVCVGGDGTLNEIINGAMGKDGLLLSEILVGFIPRGTGCDLARSLSIPFELNRALDTIRNSNHCHIDLGRLRYRDNDGHVGCRYFHNVVSFGLGGEVDARVNRTTKLFGGFTSFIWATLISVLCFKKKPIHLRVDDHFEDTVTSLNVAVANGQYHGGGMWVAPGADMTDGLFQCTVIGDLTKAQVLWNLPKLYNGKIYDVRKIRKLIGRRIESSSPQAVLLDMDGEQPGRLPVAIEMVPSVLPLICR
jgi:YegS/Rv2252/BmrU family lipid kinase